MQEILVEDAYIPMPKGGGITRIVITDEVAANTLGIQLHRFAPQSG